MYKLSQTFFLFLLTTNDIVSENLKILFVVNKFPYESRPYIDNQIAAFLDRGIDVNVLAFERSDHETYELATKYKFKNITFYNKLPENKRAFDIIYCQFPSMGHKMIQWKKKNKVKGSIITFFRAGCEFQTIEQEAKKYTSLFEKSMYIFVVCQAFKDRLIAYGYPEQKIIVHHSAINTNNFPYYARTLKDKEIKILTIGRLHPMKGHSYSIQAIKMLSDLGYNITYNIYGEGKEHNALLKLIKELKLENTVYLKNYCSHKDVVNLLHNHHIFLLTSCTTQTGSQEGIPNVLMEAMATGMPIVSTWHSGIPELITDKKNGLLVPEYDSQATAEALLELITHSTDWPKLATEARKYVLNEHNTKKQTEKVLQLFYKIKNSKIGEK